MENQLAPTQEIVKPLVSVDQAVEQWNIFEDLKQKLLVKDDYAKIQGKPYVKKSGFRKIAVFFNLSDEIIHEERVDREDRSFYWRIKVKATAPNNRTSIGVGICDSNERRFSHVEHDVYATAHTRAKNRAISDMVAGGIVSAEEMGADRPPAQTPEKKNPKPKTGPPPKQKPRKVDANAKVTTKTPDQDEETVINALLDHNLRTSGSIIVTKRNGSVWIQHPAGYPKEKLQKYKKALTDAELEYSYHEDKNAWEVQL